MIYYHTVCINQPVVAWNSQSVSKVMSQSINKLLIQSDSHPGTSWLGDQTMGGSISQPASFPFSQNVITSIIQSVVGEAVA